MLAALRMWRGVVEGTVGYDLEMLCDIANNDREPKDGIAPALGPDEIDDLCERINS